MTSSAHKLLEEALSSEFPFVIYRHPEKNTFQLIIQKSKELVFKPYKEVDNLQGFLIAPFRGKKINQLICLAPDTHFDVPIDNIDFGELLNGLFLNKSEDDRSGYVMTKEEYLERAEYLVEVLKDGDLRKVVLSRVIDQSLPDSFNPGLFVHGLFDKYPKAFVYLACLPGYGVWAGATPEVLLKLEDDHAETVALAGTKPVEDARWTEKEIKEQQIVTDYIEELLFNNNITEYGKTGVSTITAGNVVHLKTGFNISLEQLEGKIGDVLAALHPTPAVCGLPRDKAYKLIKQVEKHDRRLYSGFLGPWGIDGQSRLYVNLRCAEICDTKMSLYVGGGLTADSEPQEEWEETIHKSKTLLSVVENL